MGLERPAKVGIVGATIVYAAMIRGVVDEEAGLAVSAERILTAVRSLRARNSAATPADAAAANG